MDKVVELVGGGSVINRAYPVLFLKKILRAALKIQHKVMKVEELDIASCSMCPK